MNPDHETVKPPEWAEALLRLSLRQADRETVSGDLLEAYRDTIVPARGRRAADVWYARQVAWFLWRATWLWALIFSGAFIARTAYDWLVPTTEFHVRAEVSTYIGVATFLLMGFWAAWRSGSVIAGTVVAALASQIAAVFSAIGASALLAVWHDPQTLRAIAGSGGLEEVYLLPFMMIVPALILGTIAGAAGRFSRAALRAN
jgi:hypothetical protein